MALTGYEFYLFTYLFIYLLLEILCFCKFRSLVIMEAVSLEWTCVNLYVCKVVTSKLVHRKPRYLFFKFIPMSGTMITSVSY